MSEAAIQQDKGYVGKVRILPVHPLCSERRDFPKRSLVTSAAKEEKEPILLKNSKIRQPLFFARICCDSQIETDHPVEPLRASDIANDGLGRPPRRIFTEAFYGQVFHPFSRKLEFFNNISPTCNFAALPPTSAIANTALPTFKLIKRVNCHDGQKFRTNDGPV
ncbi:hypothetical protein [Roseobacter sp. OBYS 0001]|uniref:hypothetical protein n=1 Tax=Roseobacter sp. OBYS 0001 TaxID=882651 RepID=UPI001C817162|nr:hypothetical protein [Roseobacter sp. OBYS 0001]